MNNYYSSYHFSPAGIKASAALYGVSCVPPTNAKVMTIGHGKALDLIHQAAAYPLSTLVGIDIDPGNISAGIKKISEYGLENVHLYGIDLQDLLTTDPGLFDYIIIQDIFALLNNEFRNRLLMFCEKHLTKNGVMAIKWNALPGAKITETLRDAIALHGQDAKTDEEKISLARATLACMDSGTTDGVLKEHIKEALAFSDVELLLHYIYSANDGCYFTEFNALLEKNHLQYVGDAVSQYELSSYYGSKVDCVHTIATEGKDKVETQQYLDLTVDRQVRFSLAISRQNKVTISRLPQTEVLKDFHWAGNFQRRIENATHYNRQEKSLTTDNDLLHRILDVIGDSWPLSISTQQIIQNTLLQEYPENHTEKVLATLTALYMQNVPGIYLASNASPYNESPHNKLRLICSIAPESFADSDSIELKNLWGEKATLTKNEYDFVESGLNICNEQEYICVIDLVSKGLLTGSDFAWLKMYQKYMSLQNIDIFRRRISSYLLFAGSEKMCGFRKERAIHNSMSKKTDSHTDLRLLKKANQLYVNGKVSSALEIISGMVEKQPGNIKLLSEAAVLFFKSGEVNTALKYAMAGLSIYATDSVIYKVLTQTLAVKNDRYYPQKIAQYILRTDSNKGNGWHLLSSVCREQQQGKLHEYCARKAVEHNSNNPDYLIALGNVLSERNQISEARKYLEKAVHLSEASNKYFAYYSSFLFTIMHDYGLTPDEIRKQHETFGAKASLWAKNKKLSIERPKNDKKSGRLRIGFVSGDFRDHSVAKFIYPVWNTLDRERFEIFGYNASPRADRFTNIFKELSDEWHDIQLASYTELAELIVEDQIDILIDLSGHTSYNRLPTFALKPAPVQMSWIGYPGTTGMREIDYYIIDSNYALPGMLDDHFIEKLAYLPAVRQFEAQGYSPEVNALPALTNGFVTFASFNRPQKITSDVLDCWAEILIQLPSAKLLLASMSDEEMIAKHTEELVQRGVNSEQIEGRLKTALTTYIDMHREVDVILDTFPYTGGTTTNYASWMGVPSLTLSGDRVVSRQAGASMTFLGLEEFIAYSKEEYISKAVALNHQYEYLNNLRLSLRQRIIDKEKNVRSIACYFEQVMECAWDRYQQGLPAQPIIIEQDKGC